MSALTQASPAERHRLVATAFTAIVDGVRDWDGPTPVSEWRASDIVEHLTGWIPGFLDTFAGVKLDAAPAGADLRTRWATQCASLQALLESDEATRVITTDFAGTLPIQELVDRFYTTDVFMHSWDLAKASGQQPNLDADLVAEMLPRMTAMSPMLVESGQFGTPQPVAADASDLDKLIALIGRDPNWTPTA